MSKLSDTELIRKRGTLKGRLTSFEKYVSSFSGVTTCNEVQALELKLRMDKMNEVFSEFDNIQNSIETKVDDYDDQERTANEIQREEFESQFYRSMARAEELHRSFDKPKTSKSCSSSSSSQNHGDGTVKQSNSLKGIKLPTIQIPSFSGDYSNWLEFRDTYVSLIHSNMSITSIQKFHYLRASLGGSAAQIIGALEFSASNYTVAWSALCERYDNTRLLVQNHVKAIFNEDCIKKESFSSIRWLLDAYTKNMRALQILGEPTEYWDTLIIFIMSSKLDPRTLREWEEHKIKHNKLTFEMFTKFLKNRADLLETIELTSNTNTHETSNKNNYQTVNKNLKALTSTAHNKQTKIFRCPLCNEEHLLYKCEKFVELSVDDREEIVKNTNACTNCLKIGHSNRVCWSGPCKMCKQKHNSLLHRDKESEPKAETPPTTALSVTSNRCGQVLLATALINIRDVNNKQHEVRAVLDSGSQASFMAESLMIKLGLPYEHAKFSVAGISNSVSVVNKQCKASIQSRLNTYSKNLTFLVLPQVTTLTNRIVDVGTLEIPSHIPLADPEFYSPSSLELLLGADIFWDLIGTKQVRLNNGLPVLQETKFGYIVSGPTGKLDSNRLSCNFSQFDAIQDQLAKFWAIEEIPETIKPNNSIEENMCEEHFLQNMSRKSDGRFSVAIPLKMPESELGDSFHRAKRCFLSLERRFQREPMLRSMYVDFMNEYAYLEHMTKGDINNPPVNSYYLPHHGVLREQSSTTKLRAVFNASSPTSSGLSLNDIQMVGPTIQSDLFAILLRFRQHRYVLAGDIEKMYRMVSIHEKDRHLQQIIWRDDPSKPLEAYTLNTVTYGTASAPFLAVRCLKQLADECNNEHISRIIREDFYVDDLLTGDSSSEGLIRIRSLVSEILASGCFNLRKFKSNLPECNSPDPSSGSVVVDLSENTESSILGLKWSPSTDKLHYVIKDNKDTKVTKRVILSTISQVFDPLGLLSIFIINGKILLQKLWLHKLQWDDPLPREVLNMWSRFVAGLTYLNELQIPRFVLCTDPVNIQIHAFCDASKDAYGACVYLRSEKLSGEVEVNLLCAKSRVAPLKANTIPRLELSGALAAARLVRKVMTTNRLDINKCFLWTDSSVVLCWLKTAPNKLKVFVKNRVSEIQELTQNFTWRYVPTAQNPADLLSRGVTMTKIQDLNTWWHGPEFLLNSEETWPIKSFDCTEYDLPEIAVNVVLTDGNCELFQFSRFSKLHKLKNTFVFVLRFINNCKKSTDNRIVGPISHTERQTAYNFLLKLSQIESFPEEYATLTKGQPLNSKNHLLSLSPFIDQDGLIRVGGRIKHGDFSFDKKHPVLLTSKHHLTKLIFIQSHIQLMHAGPQLLLSSVREHIWPLGGRNLSKNVVHKCLRCFRLNAKTANPIMGNLPEQRLQPGYPFQTTGMDYAGPLIALNRRGRGSKTEKVYIAIFVCFTTKSIHLELVSDLTKDSFLSVLRRFIARRSKPQYLYSDNGTQFVGAKNDLYNFFKHNGQLISSNMSQEGIEFKFIPAYTPHMAGLAEAGVKSVKMHLRRVLGNAHLVYEDLYTVLVQIEAILNSRPLTPLSSDPNDMTPLTPGHFLVGRPLTALPTPTLTDANHKRLPLHERLERMRQDFWTRWNKEYIGELQERTKWRASKGLLKEGALVLIKDDSSPPLKWSLGRVIKVYPGTDGVNRVADLNTSKGVIRRAFNRICPLPLEDSS